MRATNIFRFIRHIGNMRAASGKKRVAYAFGNMLLMALCVLSALCVKWSWTLMSDSSFIFGLFCVIVSVAVTVLFFLQGVLAQIALIFIAGIGIATPEDRSGNIAAFIIALLTAAGMITACILLLKLI